MHIINIMKQDKTYQLLRPIFTFIFKTYFNPTYIGRENLLEEGAFVIAGNHKHALDPIFVDSSNKRTIFTLAKSELHEGPFAFLFKAVGTIPVDLNAKNNPKALKSAIDRLNEGYIINVSPEAERNYTNEILLPFKKGAVKMAREVNCPIIPYCIVGDYKFHSKNLKIVIGEPLNLNDLEVDKANEVLFNTIKKMLLENK